ncbi:zinc-binding dehydrogenase [Nocardia takedensis]
MRSRTSHVVEQYGATHDGMLATYAVLEQDSVVRVPEYLTDVEAATLTCASSRGHLDARQAERLRAMGVEQAVAREELPEWDRRVRDLSGGDGVDRVVDAVGMATSVRSAAYNAEVTMVGAKPGPAGTAGDGNPFGSAYLSIRRIAVGNRNGLERMTEAMAARRVRPVIDRIFPLTLN